MVQSTPEVFDCGFRPIKNRKLMSSSLRDQMIDQSASYFYPPSLKSKRLMELVFVIGCLWRAWLSVPINGVYRLVIWEPFGGILKGCSLAPPRM
jgi:hypothetical protein